MTGDWLGSILIILTVGILIVITELLARKGTITASSARKLLHISSGNIIFFIPLFQTKWLIIGIPLFFVLVNLFLGPLSPLKKIRLRTFSAGHSMGTVFYPLSLSIVIYFAFDNMWIVAATFLPLVYGDSLASYFGQKATIGLFTVWGVQKSRLGTLVMSAASLFSVMLALILLGFDLRFAITVGSLVALIAPLIELLSPRGCDNLLIPPVLLFVILSVQDQLLIAAALVVPTMYAIGIFFGAFIAMISLKLGFLTPDGALAGFILSCYMLGLGGWIVGVQLFIFFFFGTLATRLVRRKRKGKQDEFEKGTERRDSAQALAKAGLPAILSFIYLLFPDISVFYLLSSIMATSLVDTMATEVGIASGGTPRIILRPWVRAESGESGAVSIQGTLGGYVFGLIFAAMVVLTAYFSDFALDNFRFMVIVPLAGVLGMFADSVIGYRFQRMNRCVECEKILESDMHHGKRTQYHRGIRGLNNDLVNFAGTALGGLFGMIIFILFTL